MNKIPPRFGFMSLSTFHAYFYTINFGLLGTFSLENRGKPSNPYLNYTGGYFHHSSLHENIYAKSKQKGGKDWIFLTTNCAYQTIRGKLRLFETEHQFS